MKISDNFEDRLPENDPRKWNSILSDPANDSAFILKEELDYFLGRGKIYIESPISTKEDDET